MHFLVLGAEDIKNITLTISGVTDIVRQQLEFIAAINRTPLVKLLGISPSGFNATGRATSNLLRSRNE